MNHNSKSKSFHSGQNAIDYKYIAYCIRECDCDTSRDTSRDTPRDHIFPGLVWFTKQFGTYTLMAMMGVEKVALAYFRGSVYYTKRTTYVTSFLNALFFIGVVILPIGNQFHSLL